MSWRFNETERLSKHPKRVDQKDLVKIEVIHNSESFSCVTREMHVYQEEETQLGCDVYETVAKKDFLVD